MVDETQLRKGIPLTFNSIISSFPTFDNQITPIIVYTTPSISPFYLTSLILNAASQMSLAVASGYGAATQAVSIQVQINGVMQNFWANSWISSQTPNYINLEFNLNQPIILDPGSPIIFNDSQGGGVFHPGGGGSIPLGLQQVNFSVKGYTL